MTPILELKNVSAGYDHEVILHQVNLKIYEHDFLGIIGPNGGGKTTLLKVILGLLKPYSGEVIYPVSRQNLFGYLPQNSRFDQRFPIDVTEVVLSGLMSEKGLYKSYMPDPCPGNAVRCLPGQPPPTGHPSPRGPERPRRNGLRGLFHMGY